MFKLFGDGRTAGMEAFWPLSKIVDALKARFGHVDKVGEDGPLKVYGVEDNGINFVVAMMQTGPGTGEVVELGFLARFVGFDVTAESIRDLNRNLHISIATLEQGELYLLAGMQVIGAFDEGQFNLIIEAWRRDLAVCIHGISGEPRSMAEAFPVANLEAARTFATNMAPPADGPRSDIDMLSAFMGAGRSYAVECDECGGRGKRGLIARTCSACDGEGLVTKRR